MVQLESHLWHMLELVSANVESGQEDRQADLKKKNPI